MEFAALATADWRHWVSAKLRCSRVSAPAPAPVALPHRLTALRCCHQQRRLAAARGPLP